MKKQVITFLIALIQSQCVHSQIVIHESDFPAQEGSRLMYYEGWNTFSFDVVTAGPSYFWNFQDADTLSLNLLTEEIRPLISSPFPGVNHLAFKEIPGFTWMMDYKETHSCLLPDKLMFKGFKLYNNYTSDTTIIEMNPGLDYMIFPLTYGTSWTEFHRMNGIMNGTPIYSDSVRGESQIDGWGQLLTPFGSYECLRLQTQWSVFDEDLQTWQVLDTTLAWLANNIPAAFLIEQYSTDPETGLQSGWFRIFHSMILGVDEKPHLRDDFYLSIFPDPTHGQFTLELEDVSNSSTITVEIFSMLGEKVKSVELPAMKHHTFDISNHQPGLYLIRVLQGNVAGTQKILLHK